MRRSPLIFSFAIALGALALGACSGDDDDDTSDAAAGSASGSSAVEVIADDLVFDHDSYDATAGSIDVTYVNEGAVPHTLVIEDVDGFKLEVASSGDEDQGSVELESGDYTLYCDVPGHRAAGMEATLEVS